jgi:hypothetical protein
MPGTERTESDVQEHTEQAGSREPAGEYVGRVARDDAEDVGETGAERRAREAKAGEGTDDS